MTCDISARQSRTGIVTINTITYWLVLLFSVFPFVFKYLGIQERFSSIQGTIATTVVLLVCFFMNFKQVVNKNRLICLLINLLFLTVTVMFKGGLGVATIHINMLLALWIFNNMKFKRKQCATIHILTAVLLLFWLLSLDMSLMWKSFVFEPSGLYVNPCTVAILGLACYYHAIAFFELIHTKKKFFKRCFYIAITVAAGILIVNTVCRSSLMAFFVFFVLLFFKDKVSRKYQTILTYALIFVLVFPIVYIYLAQVMEGFEFFGKNFFTQRDNVWKSVYSLIFEEPILGAGSNSDIFLMGGLMDDAHNLFLGIWKNIGIVPMVTMFIVLRQGKNLKKVTKQNQIMKIMFLTGLVISTVETMLNGSEYYVFYLTFLMTVAEDNNVRMEVQR